MTLEEKAGTLAGKVWEYLNATDSANEKEIMKGIKVRRATEFYLAIGWLLREGKLDVFGTEEAPVFKLK